MNAFAVIGEVESAPAPRRERHDLFEALYRDTRDDLFSYLSYLLGSRLLAEDVTAVAYEKAFAKRTSFDARRGDRRAWLFGIARNAAIDEMRKARDVVTLDFAVREPAADSHGVDTTERIAIAQAMRELAVREREIVALKFFGGLTNREIARVMNVGESNVGTLLHRAVKQLREVLS